MMPRWVPIQLMMLYWESNIHFHVIELSAIGIVHGRRIINRKTRVPGKFSASRNARVVPKKLLKTAAISVKKSVLRSAVRNTDDWNRLTKLSKPTKLPRPLVATLASLTLKYKARANGYPTNASMYKMAPLTSTTPSTLWRSRRSGSERHWRARLAAIVTAPAKVWPPLHAGS